MDFISFCIVFLSSGPNRAEAGQDELEQIQKQHLEHIGKLHTDGYALVAGPFGEQTDKTMRGLIIFRGDLPIAKVIELAEADPAVKAGRLQVQAVRWYCEKDYVIFPGSTSASQRENA